MQKRWARAVAVTVLLGVGVFATLGEAESGGDGESGSGDGAETRAPESSQDNPIPLGTDVEVAEGWNLKVNSAEINANATAEAANMFNKPQPNNQFVMVNVTITNKTDEPAEPFLEMKLSLLPPSGVASDPSIVAGIPGEIDMTAQMQPGASVTGNMIFEVPAAEADRSVLLGQSVFTLDEKKDQKFFAIR